MRLQYFIFLYENVKDLYALAHMFSFEITVADRAYGVGHIISTLYTYDIATTLSLFSTRSGTSGQIPDF